MKKIAISNLVFGQEPIGHTLKFLENSQIEGLELAPTLVWKNPELVSKKERNEFKNLVFGHGLSIVALQSLLYSKPQFQLFADSKTQEALLEFLKEMVNLCADLGGRSLSFGSPKSRIKGDLELDEAITHITPFFYTLAEYAKSLGIIVCIEPVASEFKCDFINNTKEGVQLVESVGHPQFKLLLDVGTLILNKEDCKKTILNNIHHIAHIHINDPLLFPPSKIVKEHLTIADTLKSVGYSDWLTLEFLHCYTSLEKDITYGLECYRSS